MDPEQWIRRRKSKIGSEKQDKFDYFYFLLFYYACFSCIVITVGDYVVTVKKGKTLFTLCSVHVSLTKIN
jgi:hypothetical protein